MYLCLRKFWLEKILKEVRKELTARIEWTKEELKQYGEQLNRVNKALEELKKLFSPKERR
ncbi:MAG: hypothetical protein QXK95_03045 [Nitrososphaerota archaeon]